MSNAPERFGRLAAQFEVMAHNLTDCQNPRQRRGLLIGMMVVLDQIVDILLANEHLFDSKLASTTRTTRPLMKAAHQ
jgi:hypothetical protein